MEDERLCGEVRSDRAGCDGESRTESSDEDLQRPGVPAAESDTTVLVVAYNHAEFVAETLDSIRAQTKAPKRVLIADDASPNDDTAEAITSWLADAPSCYEFHPNKENIGLNPTLNSLLAKVDTEFVTYIAADDVMRSDRIERHEALLSEAGESVSLVYSDARVIDEKSRLLHETSRIEFPWPDEPRRTDETTSCLLDGNWIPAASIFMRTRDLLDAGGYRQDLFFEDFELLVRMSVNYGFEYTEEPLVDVRRLSTSLGSTGFRGDSFRFIKANYAAMIEASRHADRTVATRALRIAWELAKRAVRSDAPPREALAMMVEASGGARTKAHAVWHAVKAAPVLLSRQVASSIN